MDHRRYECLSPLEKLFVAVIRNTIEEEAKWLMQDGNIEKLGEFIGIDASKIEHLIQVRIKIKRKV